jgi:CHAT domain-containing protein/tetratricopeptide (TPR) repeat protein
VRQHIDIPPGFETDISRVQQLEARRQPSPRTIISRIRSYKRILGRLHPEEYPVFYTFIQANLGTAYSDLPTGDRVANLERAIACYREALRFWMLESSPLDYALTQNNLGTAYWELPSGDRAANLAQAIACYREALRFLTPEIAPLDYAMTQHNLGAAYSDLPTGDHGVNLEHAIACYREALRFWTPETSPLDYAMTQNSLGTAYNDLLVGDRVTNLNQAIACYQEALRFWTAKTAPLDYALTQTNLAVAYMDLPTGDRAVNLAQAISCCQEALCFLTPGSAPLDYAHTQSCLGNAYSQLSAGDRVANLSQAIACYREALLFRTPETALLDYALTQHNLGAAYHKLPTGDRATNLTQAISYYREALRFWTPETAPLDYAMAQANLGTAYCYLPTGDRAANLAQAIACYQEALRYRTPETSPFDYASTQISLGAAYYDLPTGDRATNLTQAISCYQEALRFLTPETAPFDYARVQNNLATAYRDQPAGDRISNLAWAIACYRQALRVWTLETAPSEYRKTTQNLADLYFAQGEWHAALGAYRAAINAGELLYRAGLSAESKATEVAENATLYRQAAFAAVRCGQTADALLLLERGKTRLLTEALRLHIPRPANVPDKVWTTFEDAGATVRAAQTGGNALPNKEHDLVQTYAAREQSARADNAALDAAIERVREYAPDFLKEISLFTLLAHLPDECIALVAFCITGQGSISFIVSRNYDQAVQVVDIPTFTQTDLRNLLVERDADGRVNGGWLVAYDHYLSKPTPDTFAVWQETITDTLVELGQRLLAPTLSALPDGIKRIIFLPSAELFLLPLHAALLSGDNAGRVCDHYQTSYIPSFEVLANVQANMLRRMIPELYAVINPQADPALLFTPFEGEAIARLFVQCQVDEGRIGTKERVIAGMQGRTHVHFACHGSYNWNDQPASGLALADSHLTLAELQQGVVDLSSTRLVTLSACETGLIDVMQGVAEEYVGIPAGFLIAGVPCVVSSLWVVPDLSTSLLMGRFYRNHLGSGLDIATALREAQGWVREITVGEVVHYVEQWNRQSHGEEQIELFKYLRHYRYLAEQNPTLHPFAHPYYWAAFTSTGV